MPSTTTTSHAVVAGIRLPYTFAPASAGRAVVLLHGLTDSSRSFDPVIDRLSGQLPLFAPTYRGHGDADRPPDGYRPQQLADDVLAMLDELEIGPAVIVGHSLGASVALRLAVSAPDRVAGLVLVAAFATPAENAAVAEVQSMVADLVDPVPYEIADGFQRSTFVRPIPEALLDTFIGESLKVPAHVWRAATDGFVTTDHLEGLDALEVPTLLVWGDEDAFVTLDDQDRLLEAMPDARLSVYRGTGHAVHWEEPDRFCADLRDFCRALD